MRDSVTAQDDDRRPLWIDLIESAHRSIRESSSRSANERFVRAITSRGAPTDRVSIGCECGAPTCREIVTLTFEEYENVRAHPAWFLVSAEHVNDQMLERRVGAGPGYVVVEKIGSAGVETEGHSQAGRGSA
jgi:hypothetical protein